MSAMLSLKFIISIWILNGPSKLRSLTLLLGLQHKYIVLFCLHLIGCASGWVINFSLSRIRITVGITNRPTYNGSFHLCLLDFPFIYHFYSIMTTLIKSTCLNPADLFILKSFHQHFEFFDKVCYLKQKCSFCFYLFWSMVKCYLKW